MDYDPATARYTLPAEHAVALTDESSPAFLPGLFQIAVGTVAGAGRHPRRRPPRHRCRLARAQPRRAPRLRAVLPARATTPTSSTSGCPRWVSPTGSGEGASVADVGCGHGASTVLMAEAFPASRFHGSDYHAESIEVARARAVEAGVADRVTFEVAPADGFTGPASTS